MLQVAIYLGRVDSEEIIARRLLRFDTPFPAGYSPQTVVCHFDRIGIMPEPVLPGETRSCHTTVQLQVKAARALQAES